MSFPQPDGPTHIASRRSRAAILIWALVRLPLFAMLAYLLRHPILNAIERQFDIFYITVLVVDVVSTPLARLIAGGGLFAVLLLLVLSVKRLRPLLGYSILLVAAGVVIAWSSSFAATSLRRALFVELVLAANLAPGRVVNLLRKSPRVWNTLMVAGVGIVELFVWRDYWWWVRNMWRGHAATIRDSERSVASTIPGLLITCLVFAVVLRPQKVVAFEQTLRMSAGVQLVERGPSTNWIQLDPTRAFLYVSGHDVPRLRRYDVRDLTAPPLLSDVPTNGAQGFAYDPRANEIYVFNTVTRQLLYLDATSLERKRSIEVADLSPGDLWVTVDPVTDTLTLSSEADLEVGTPFIVLDRTTGHVVARADLATGNALLHPTKPWLYLTFFRRRNEVLLYDLQSKSVTHSSAADRRAERMIYSLRRNELLVTSPMESRIMRFDADQLRPTGYIPTMFGVRAIAVDETRDLLLYGNIASGHLVVIDPANGTRLRTFYLGPWLRTIELDVPSGIAYVSSRGALYRVEYASALSTR